MLALPQSDSRREVIIRLLTTWKISIEVTQQTSTEEAEFNMIVSQAYQEWEQKTRQQGIELGTAQTRRSSIENILRVRFGELDEQLAQIIPSILELPIEEYTPLLLTLSREELIARFIST